MAGSFGQFAVALSAGVTVDRGSLAQAERTISDGLGRASRPAAAGTPYAGRGAVASSRAPILPTPAGGAARGSGAIVQMPMTQIGWGWFGRLLGRGKDTSGAAGGGGSASLSNFGAVGKATVAGALTAGKFDMHVASIRSTLAATWHMGGLGRAVESLTRLRNVASEARGGLADVARLLPGGEILAGLGTAAGIAAAMTQYGRTGQDIQNTAMSAGVSTRQLQGFRGATQLEGGSAADADTSLRGINQTLLNANAGLNSRAVQLANMLKLNTHVNPAQFFMELAGSKQFQQASAASQQQIFDVFHIAPGMQPLARKGVAGIRADIKQAEKNELLPDKDVKAAAELGKAATSAGQAVLGLADAIEARLSPATAPMLKNFTNWLDQLKQSPAAMDRVVKGGEVLAAVLGVTAVGAVAKLVAAVTTGSASMLSSPLGILLMAGAGAAEMVSAIKQGGLSGFLKSLLLPQWLQPAGTPHPTIGGAVGGLVGSGGPQSQPDRREGHDFGSAAPAKPGGGWLDWLLPGAHAAEEPGGVKAQPPETPILGKQSNLALPPLVKPFLDALAAGESAATTMSCTATSRAKARLDSISRPMLSGFRSGRGAWCGTETRGFRRTSAAGRYGFEHGTWDAEAAKLGLKDFGPASQDSAAWDLAKSEYFKRTHRELMADYPAHRGSETATALQPTWTSAGPRLAGMLDAGPRMAPGL